MRRKSRCALDTRCRGEKRDRGELHRIRATPTLIHEHAAPSRRRWTSCSSVVERTSSILNRGIVTGLTSSRAPAPVRTGRSRPLLPDANTSDGPNWKSMPGLFIARTVGAQSHSQKARMRGQQFLSKIKKPKARIESRVPSHNSTGTDTARIPSIGSVKTVGEKQSEVMTVNATSVAASPNLVSHIAVVAK